MTLRALILAVANVPILILPSLRNLDRVHYRLPLGTDGGRKATIESEPRQIGWQVVLDANHGDGTGTYMLLANSASGQPVVQVQTSQNRDQMVIPNTEDGDASEDVHLVVVNDLLPRLVLGTLRNHEPV